LDSTTLFEMRTSRVSLAVAATLAGGLAVVPPAHADNRGRYDFCPPAKTIIDSNTVWTRHKLGPGVTLADTMARGGRGRIEINVLRVDLNSPRVSVAPLTKGGLTGGQPLTSLAKHRTLVAATNGMFFNTGNGAPKVPFIKNGMPVVMSDTPEHVAGIDIDGVAQDGDVWLGGLVRSDGTSYPLSGINEPVPPTGLTLYTQAWGHHPVPVPSNSEARGVVNRQVVTGTRQRKWLPENGNLLVARGVDAVEWLSSLAIYSPLTVGHQIETDAPEPFAQAYGVGTHTVENEGEVLNGLYCRRSEIYAARTAIAWKRGGHKLMLVTVESPRAPDHYGVDENQMSQILVTLGADQAFALDGGGSTTLVARMKVHLTKHIKRHRHHHVVRRTIHRTVKRLVLKVHPRYSSGRGIPVGIGVFTIGS
jgi:hypothetical protein